MNLKSSNREGTGKKHNCLCCQNLIPLYKKYCNRECYSKYNNIDKICLNCNKSFTILKSSKNKRIYCSISCSSKGLDRKNSNIKAKETNIKRYGKSNPFDIKGYNNLNIKRNGNKISNTINNKSEEEKQIIYNKISKSLNNKSEEEKQIIQLKKQNTNLKLFGTISTLSKDSKFRIDNELKMKENHIQNINKWLLENNLVLLDEYKGVKNNKGNIIYYHFKHTLTNTIFIDHLACGRLPIYKDPNETIGISIVEKELQDYLLTLLPKDEVIFNNRKLVKGFEIDIYIPSKNIAIEFNGLRWHSELMGKNRTYHLYKTEECEKQDIQLIHIFEDEWKYKQDIIKSKIKNLINKNTNKIYARKCVIKPVINKIKNEFLNQNHIQGEDKSKFKYGLYYNDELVSLITLGNLRKITGNKPENNIYEIIRYTTKLDYNIIGGFSKLLKHFIKTHNSDKIISYADRRWSNGNLYKINNFKFIHNTPPNYWYMKYYKNREHRYKFRKSNLKNLLEKYNPNISEWENMKLNKYDRIWDCGSKKYELILR